MTKKYSYLYGKKFKLITYFAWKLIYLYITYVCETFVSPIFNDS